MEKMLREFIQFCFDHGGFLGKYKEFGEMSRRLLEVAIKHDLGARESALAKTIISSTYAHELLVYISPEMNFVVSQKFDPLEITPVFALVYRYERRTGEEEYVYAFAGGRAVRL